jgi:hypothetical protein
MRLTPGLAMLAMPLSAQAQTVAPIVPTIVISAQGSVETPPDNATLILTIRGEGKTPDAASTALAAKLKAITGGLRSLDPGVEVRTGSVAIGEAHAGECNRDSALPMSAARTAADLDRAADALSTAMSDKVDSAGAVPQPAPGDPCAVIGNVAESETTIVLRSVKDAGTAVGLAGRLGANEAKIESFDLHDDKDARIRAVAAAIGQARSQAQAIAAASGMTLGPIVSVTDGSLGDPSAGLSLAKMSMQANSYDVAPVRIEISPRPVETSLRLIVTFSLVR